MRVTIALLLGATLALAPSAAAQEPAPDEPEPPAEYRELVQQALAESAEGRWEEARVLFRRAHETFPNARTLRGIAMASFEVRDYVEAIRYARRALESERRPLTEEQRSEAEALVERAMGFVGRYELSGVPEGAELLVDGHRVTPEPDATLLLPAGMHRVVVRGEHRSWEGRWRVRGGEREELPIVFTEPDASAAQLAADEPPDGRPVEPTAPREPGPPPVGAIVTTVAGALVAAGGIAMLVAGLLDVSTVENAEDGTSWAELDGAYSRAPILTGVGSALIGVGLAAGLGGAIWLSVGGGDADEPAVSAGLRLGGAW